MDLADLPLDQLGGQAYGHIIAGDRAKERAEQQYLSAGLYLKEAKERIARRKDMTWPQFLLAHCNIGKSRANEIIMIADGRTTLETLNDRKNMHRSQPAADRVRVQSAEKTQQKQRHCADTEAAITRIVGKLKKLTIEQLHSFEKAIPDA